MGLRDPSDRRSLSWRLKISLGTLSTVLAVATGMFSLRDQIFPQQGGTAQADVNLYERSVGDVCSALNDAEQARAANARRLARRLARAHTTLAQRNALLDSTKELLARSEDGLSRLEGLHVPSARRARHRETVSAWGSIAEDLGRYAEGLDTVQSRRDLLDTVQMLPAMRTRLRADNLVRAAGLIQLGGGDCRLDSPVVTKTITLPGTGRRVTPSTGAATRTAIARQTRVEGSSSVDPPGGRSGAVDLSPDLSPAPSMTTPSVDPPVGTTVDPPADPTPVDPPGVEPPVRPDVSPPPPAQSRQPGAGRERAPSP